MGREPRSLARSVMAGALVGRDEAEMEGRLAAQLAIFGSSADAARRGSTRGATAGCWARRSRRWRASPSTARDGAERLLFQVFLPRDLEHVALLGELAGQSPSA